MVFILQKGVIFIKKEYRIKKSQEIEKIIKKRDSVGNKNFVIYKLKNNEAGHYRIGLSIGKKYGNAVKRNKIKRQIRSIIRNNKNLIMEFDYIIVIKPSASQLVFTQISDELCKLLKKFNQGAK